METRLLLVLLAVLCVSEAVTFGQLCSGNPTNSKRTFDTWGGGHYGAPRDGGTHKGLDIECEDDSMVLAPFDVTIVNTVKPYRNPNETQKAINQGLVLKGEGLRFMLFYIKPVKTRGSVRKGEHLGTMLPMQSTYPGITSHVHVQMLNSNIDPTQYF